MTDSSTGGPARGGWPFDPVSGGASQPGPGPQPGPAPQSGPAPQPGAGSGPALFPGVPPTPGGTSASVPPPVVPPSGTGPRSGASGSNRRRTLVIVGIVVGVLVLGGAVTALVLTMNRSSTPSATVTSTTQLPSPTPTVAPAAREKGSAFLDALPSSVLQYAWASVAPDEAWRTAGALEAYDVTYTDGGSGTVTVRAGQWRTAAEVTAYQTTLTGQLTAAAGSPTAGSTATAGSTTAVGPATSTGDVTVGGVTVGTWTIVPQADGAGTVVWSNGTTLFEASGPASELADLYAAFPL